MKLPQPKKLPSGRWYVQVMVDGRRKGRTFDTEKEAVYWAAGIKTRAKEAEKSLLSLTVAAAVDRYIESKDAVLSPSTIKGYRQVKGNLMGGIALVKIGDLTQENVQRWVNGLAREKSPKTVSNAHGLLSTVLKEYRPSMALRTTLPQKVKPNIQIPSEAELRAILAAARGAKHEIPIVLAVWMGLRQSEILGLTWDCVDGDTLHIRRAIVMGENGPVEKGTKTYSGTRALHLPEYLRRLLEAAPHRGQHIVRMSGKAIYSGFSRICEKAGVPHYRFHDLRHTNASIMLASGIPDKYSMKRMGHATNNMLKTTYQHVIKEREAEYDQQIDDYFKDLLPPD